MFEDILPKLIKWILKGILNKKKSILKNLIPYDTRLFSPQHKKKSDNKTALLLLCSIFKRIC